jgi:hypothetical protein
VSIWLRAVGAGHPFQIALPFDPWLASSLRSERFSIPSLFTLAKSSATYACSLAISPEL